MICEIFLFVLVWVYESSITVKSAITASGIITTTMSILVTERLQLLSSTRAALWSLEGAW